jgi:hypothetical protein
MLEALAEFREADGGRKPIAPWARQRICTAYLKHRMMDHYVASLGVDDHCSFVGLRADENDRVKALLKTGTRRKTFALPLSDAGITKADVMEFWSMQSFDLGIPDNLGNCTGCYLKDQSDLARIANDPEFDLPWWVGMQEKYPRFGGQDFAGYARLAAEGEARRKIETALRNGDPIPMPPPHIDAKRYRLVVIQERTRLRGERKAFSCSCEVSYLSEDEDDEAQLSLFA